MSNSDRPFSRWLGNVCINNRWIVLGFIVLVTLFLGYFAYHIDVKTDLTDLLPDHPYMEVHNEYKNLYGGVNKVQIMVSVNEGTIFEKDVLKKVRRITYGLRKVDGIDSLSIRSLAAKNMVHFVADAMTIGARPVMYPKVPQTDKKMRQLRQTVLETPTIYGNYVSEDLKGTLITAEFITDLLDPSVVFQETRDLIEPLRSENVNIQVVGNPILYGWVNYYVGQSLQLMFLALLSIAVFLFLFLRSWRGMLLPAICSLVSGVWALGAAELLGLHFDPLVIVIAFLIMARVVSASVQSIMRFERKIRQGIESIEAARQTLGAKWTPGVLAVTTDAGAILIVAITPIPILQKIAFIGFLWLLTVPLTSIILTNIGLSFTDGQPADLFPFSLDPLIDKLCSLSNTIALTKWRYAVLGGVVVAFVGLGYLALKIPIGPAKPGTSILWPDSPYNQAIRDMNAKFPGSEELFVVAKGDTAESTNPITEPKVLNAIDKFQNYMVKQPEIGGTLSVVDIISSINRNLHEGNPRFTHIAHTQPTNYERLYFYASGGGGKTFLKRYTNLNYTHAGVKFFFLNHKGNTIKTAIDRAEKFIRKQKSVNDMVEFKLAGGAIGVLAATNQVIREDVLMGIILALLLVVILCALTYSNPFAGFYLMIPILLANVVTFGYMSWREIGLNVNSLPVAALGIGLGIDYAIYVADNIRDVYQQTGDISEAIVEGLDDSGRAVVITVLVLVVSIGPFLFSALRFQAEMALLIALWMFIAAVGAILLIPSLIRTFRPNFIEETE